MNYDYKCYELAEYFLDYCGSEKLKEDLAQAIQTRIEDWLNHECAAVADKLGVPNPQEEEHSVFRQDND
jgi:hypothetical protein